MSTTDSTHTSSTSISSAPDSDRQPLIPPPGNPNPTGISFTDKHNSSTSEPSSTLSPTDARRQSGDRGRKSSEGAESGRSRSRSWGEHHLTEEEVMRRKMSVTNVPAKHQGIKEKFFTNKLTPDFLK
ncbi:hypothetical protein B0A48_16552 [Cryoendolithus antarcticus]|uniref:Uncharacterized protein n=1 Tax=Cryoendolithus antarcticus TaxID=1507870 RepID=A0A1V8SE76_9PEZI|nr:hypothetical protein B0A48_16552 [Cryoendolithus antarcticus]